MADLRNETVRVVREILQERVQMRLDALNAAILDEAHAPGLPGLLNAYKVAYRVADDFACWVEELYPELAEEVEEDGTG